MALGGETLSLSSATLWQLMVGDSGKSSIFLRSGSLAFKEMYSQATAPECKPFKVRVCINCTKLKKLKSLKYAANASSHSTVQDQESDKWHAGSLTRRTMNFFDGLHSPGGQDIVCVLSLFLVGENA